MDAAEVVVERVQVDPCERTDSKYDGNRINQKQAENSEIQVVDTPSFKCVFLDRTRHVETE